MIARGKLFLNFQRQRVLSPEEDMFAALLGVLGDNEFTASYLCLIIMKYFAVISKMKDLEKNKEYREEHLDYIKTLAKEGRIFAKGRFSDYTGGLVICIAQSLEEVKPLVENDPFIVRGARTYEIHEWEMTLMEQSK